jgi:hypothetical protein
MTYNQGMDKKERQTAQEVTRLLLADWIPDLDERGWWHMGSGMQGPGEPMTEAQYQWLVGCDC